MQAQHRNNTSNASSRETRKRLIAEWIDNMLSAVHGGKLGQRFRATIERGIVGPRVGALLINAGFQTGELLRVLQANDSANARQLIPRAWEINGSLNVFMDGRDIRVECGWPDYLAVKDFRLSELLHNINRRPYSDGRWLAGIDDSGGTIVGSFTGRAAHWLIAGTTGSGKSVATRTMLTQLANPNAPAGTIDLVLIDGKQGDGLRDLDYYPGVVGPIACSIESARASLGWAASLMLQRLAHPDLDRRRTVIVLEEVQEFAGDPAIVEMIRRIAAQGRSAAVHLIITTQHPTNASFGDNTIKRNVNGRIAMLVSDFEASKAATGNAAIRADRLMGEGDCYVISPGAVHRVQCAYVPDSEIRSAPRYQHMLDDWPEFDSTIVERLPVSSAGSGASETFSIDEQVISLIGATHEPRMGRPALLTALDAAGFNRPGSIRADRLLKIGRDFVDGIRAQGWNLIKQESMPG